MINWPFPRARFSDFLKTPTSTLLLLGVISLGLTQNLSAQVFGEDPSSPSVSSGPVTVNFAYDGNKTVISYTAPTGALAGLTFDYTASSIGAIGQVTFTAGSLVHTYNATSYDLWSAAAGSPDWGTGTGSFLSASSADGDLFAISSDGFWVPAGYDLFNGTTLSGSMTFLNSSLTQLGFSSNSALSGSFTVGATTVNWTTSAPASPVPEPGTTAVVIALAAVGLVAFSRTRRSADRPPQS